MKPLVPPRFAPLLLPIIVSLFVAQAVFLGGATSRWVQALLLIELGLCLVVRPPRGSLGVKANLLLGGLVGAGCVGFLPQRWLPVPPWKVLLRPYFEEVLPASLAAQPWLSFEALIMLVLAVSWFYWVATLPVERPRRLLIMRLYGAACVGIAAACLWYHWKGGAPGFWNHESIGPFANHNQTANVLGVGGLLVAVFMAEAVRKRSPAAWAWLGGLAVLATAVVMVQSRAGVLILTGGFALWTGMLLWMDRSWKQFSLAATVVVIGAGLLLVFARDITARFFPAEGFFRETTALRWQLQAEALRLGLTTPWTGSGLASFPTAFALWEGAGLPGHKALHPESDWHWLWVELGVSGVLAAAGAVLYFGWRTLPLARRPGWRTELGAVAALFAFLAHSFFDPSGHRLGSVLPVLMLAAIIVQPTTRPASALFPYWFRGLGVIFVVIGSGWLLEQGGYVRLPGSLDADRAQLRARIEVKAGRLSDALGELSAAVALTPLDWRLYFQRAKIQLQMGDTPGALSDFHRAKLLVPNFAAVPDFEGGYWASADSRFAVFALSAWQQALELDNAGAPDRFAAMLIRAQRQPRLRAGLERFAWQDRRLLLIWLDKASREQFEAARLKLQAEDPELASFSNDQRQRFFRLWALKGELSALAAAIDGHPGWLATGWNWVASDLAARGDFHGAYLLARQHIGPPPMPSALDGRPRRLLATLRHDFALDRHNSAVAFELAEAEAEAGNFQRAADVAQDASLKPAAPLYFFYLESEYAARSGDWPRAWKTLAQFARL